MYAMKSMEFRVVIIPRFSVTCAGMLTTALLTDCWYVAAPSSQLARGETLALTLLGQEILFGRTRDGEVFALKDFCPHRGMPLRYGRFDGCEVECCYHGWRFNIEGTCTAIPSLLPDDETDISRIRIGNYPTQEKDGLIWIFIGEKKENLPEVPSMPSAITGGFRHIESVEFPCPIDHAVIGLMDPSHGPFVHQSWWWRSRRSIHIKQKPFEPIGMGFKMASHTPSSNSRAYKILGGGERKTEIAFQLPGLRTEHITVGKHVIVLLTALTPIDASRTMLHQFFFSTMPLLNFLLPGLKPFGRAFIKQDLITVQRQVEGLNAFTETPLLLMGDADAQARWYFRLKKEFLDAQAQDRPFENKLKARNLRWQS